MSLVLLYKDELVTDQRCSMLYPHALGCFYNATKMRIAANGTFAIGIVGPTLSPKEFDVLEAVITTAFKETKGDLAQVEIGHEEWLKQRGNMSFLVMTKKCSYFSYLPWESVEGHSRGLSEVKVPTLVQYNSSLPAGAGTGLHVASLAVREGVKMKELMYLVSRVISSVGPEFDYVHRKTLKAFKYV